MDCSNLKERATNIFETAYYLSDELTRLGLPEPSFQHGLPTALHSDAPDSNAGAARQKLLQMLDEFRLLLTKPALLLTSERRNPSLSAHPIIRLGIAENFPTQGATIQHLANKLNLRESLLSRLLAHSATYHVFYQAFPGFFVHTAASRLLAENKGMREWILSGAEDILPATLKTASALAKYPNSEEPEHSGWSVNNATNLPIFKALANLPDQAMLFAGAMTWHAMLPGFSPQYLIAAFPWGSGGELTVVDVGGGLGHVSVALASHSPTVKCIVEDWPDVVAQGQEGLPADLQGRVSFQAHDFFQEQPIKGADVYLLRIVLHDWSDKYAKMIIKAIIPALVPGAKVVINDRMVPGLGEVHYLTEREARDSDLCMLALQNGKERTVDDWSTLFKEADPRFKLTRTYQPPKSYLAIIEVTWEALHYSAPSKKDFSGQTIIVTGANAGLGFEASRHLVRLGAEKVILAVRSLDKGETAKKDIEASTKRKGVVEVWRLDLSSYDSVKEFAKRAETLKRLDAVVENAGINITGEEFQLAEDNESSITVNVVSTFLLALMILPKLRETSAKYNVTPHLVVLTLELHFVAELPEREKPNIFDALNDKKNANIAARYPVTKLLEVFYVRELVSRMKQNNKRSVIVNLVNPGFCHSGLVKHKNLAFKVFSFIVARSTEAGSRTLVAGVEAGDESHGQYMSESKSLPPSPFVLSKEGEKTQQRVWDELSAKLEKIQPGIMANV